MSHVETKDALVERYLWQGHTLVSACLLAEKMLFALTSERIGPMDPNANLDEQVSIAAALLKEWDFHGTVDIYDSARLAELVIALDEWIRKGGSLPNLWQNNSKQ